MFRQLFLWLTLDFPNLCVSVYILLRYPPVAPAPPCACGRRTALAWPVVESQQRNIVSKLVTTSRCCVLIDHRQLRTTVMASVAMLHQRWKGQHHRFTTSCNAHLQTNNIFDVSPVSPTSDQSTSLMLHFCNTLPPTSRTWCSHAEFRNNKLFLQPHGTAGTGDMAKPLEPNHCHHQNYLSICLRFHGITPWTLVKGDNPLETYR